MTNSDLIRASSNEGLAAFLHRLQAGALLACHADSEEWLLQWLDEEVEDQELTGNEEYDDADYVEF